MELRDLVKFQSDDPELLAKVVKAVEWVYSKPEGKEVIERAYRQHGKPVIVAIGNQVQENAFTMINQTPVIFINPELLKRIPYMGADGKRIESYSLERLVAHEFKHASQAIVWSTAEVYHQTKLSIFSGLIGNCLRNIPLATYQRRIVAAPNDAARAKLFGEMYDRHVAGHIPTIQKEFIEQVSQNPIVRRFVQEYEDPAVEFENLMASYLGETLRAADYIRSAMFHEMATGTDRTGFIASAIQNFHMARHQGAQQRQGKNPQEVRPDASLKPTGENNR